MNLHEFGPIQVLVANARPSEAVTAIVINDSYIVSYDAASKAVRASTDDGPTKKKSGMSLTEKLIGKQLNDAAPVDATLPGIQKVPVVIKTAVPAENYAAVIINGSFILPLSEATRIAENTNV